MLVLVIHVFFHVLKLAVTGTECIRDGQVKIEGETRKLGTAALGVE